MVKKKLPTLSSLPGPYEIAIAGGGLAGLTAAAALAGPLAAAGKRLALIERQPFALHTTPAFDGRTTAIAWQGRQLLTAIGLWPKLAPLACPIDQISVADGFATPGLDFLSRELNVGPFGHIIENRHLRRILLDHLANQSNVGLINPASVTALDLGGPLARLTLDDGRTIDAALVLAADGKNSPLRALAGIPVFDLTYDQQAIVCVVETGQPHEHIALEHFLPQGPFAVLPMLSEQRRNFVSIVWTVQPAAAAALLAMDEGDFIAAMNHAGLAYLQPLRLAAPRAKFPLGLRHARRYTAQHFALVGEAAHAIHPIAGQGFNLGLRDIALLRQLVVEAQALGLRADDALVLHGYARQRRRDNQTMVGATDALDRLFSNAIPGLARARQLGLAAVNANGPLRRFFMRKAMGMA